MGELARALSQQWMAEGDSSWAAVREELADVFASLLKLANHTGIDLEEAYLEKMKLNQSWQTGGKNS